MEGEVGTWRGANCAFTHMMYTNRHRAAISLRLPNAEAIQSGGRNFLCEMCQGM